MAELEAERDDVWLQQRKLGWSERLRKDQAIDLAFDILQGCLSGKFWLPNHRVYNGSWGALTTQIDISPVGVPDAIWKPMPKATPTPIQLLALSILRHGEDEATIAALLDEAMALYKVKDEPITESWCLDHGWTKQIDNYPKELRGYLLYESRRSKEGLSVWVRLDSGEFGVDSPAFESQAPPLGSNPTTMKVVRLCNAMNIPWKVQS